MTTLRRFWTDAGVLPAASGFSVALDGKAARTPAGAALVTPHARLAEAIAAEWRRAPDHVSPVDLPMTGFLAAAIDRVAPNLTAFAHELARMGAHDLLCYRATEPEALAQRQASSWDPLLVWAEQRYGAALKTGSGVTPVIQSREAMQALATAVGALDAYRLAAALKICGIYKSLVLTLAVIDGAREAEAAYDLSRIDEIYQGERWGEDAQAQRRAERERDELKQTAAFLRLLD